MTDKYIFTGLLALSLYLFSAYALIADNPFFIGTHFLKYKPFEWVYIQYGSWTLSGFLFLTALLFTKLSYDQSKVVSNKEETGESVLSTTHLVIGIVIILVYMVI